MSQRNDDPEHLAAVTRIAEERGCIGPFPCGRDIPEFGGRDAACDCEAFIELRDALDDAIRRAFCEPPIPPLSAEDAEVVRNTARAAIISNPDRMRHLAAIQAAAWEVVRDRIEVGDGQG